MHSDNDLVLKLYHLSLEDNQPRAMQREVFPSSPLHCLRFYSRWCCCCYCCWFCWNCCCFYWCLRLRLCCYLPEPVGGGRGGGGGGLAKRAEASWEVSPLQIWVSSADSNLLCWISHLRRRLARWVTLVLEEEGGWLEGNQCHRQGPEACDRALRGLMPHSLPVSGGVTFPALHCWLVEGQVFLWVFQVFTTMHGFLEPTGNNWGLYVESQIRLSCSSLILTQGRCKQKVLPNSPRMNQCSV